MTSSKPIQSSIANPVENDVPTVEGGTTELATPPPSADAEPVFFVWLDGKQVAFLCDPVWQDMYWWDYRVQPTSPEFEAIIHDPKVWNRVAFQVRDADGNCPNPDTFSGNCEEYCAGNTDRLSFRSLPPPTRRSNWYRNFWIVSCIILFVWFLYFI
ncbi:MAG TPA: hypothetical protein DDW52_16110 [Planctomycetaceae bacterium]|nr:hypothetical protein [Planctomycetaceae bacterium]